MATDLPGAKATRDPGSFRDPSGYVLHHGDAVWRSLDGPTFARLRGFLETPAYRALCERGDLLPAAPASAAESERLANAERRGDRHYLRQRRLSLISYPYEWSPRMLHAAAECTLRIQAALIEQDLILKDASAYNIQFDVTERGPAPVFIDLASIETAPDRPIWMAYNQFMRHFILPLMLYRHFGHDYRGELLSDLEGVDPEAVYRLAGAPRRWFSPYLSTVTIPHLLRTLEQRRDLADDGQPAAGGSDRERDRYILSRRIRRLERLLRRLRPDPRDSAWSTYEADNSYPAAAAARKEAFVGQACASLRPARMLNLGCNRGKFDLIAAGAGARVVALDLDLASIDSLYERARANHAAILPLRADIAAPSPAIGWNNRERRALLERVCGSECLMALAVVHHLLVTNRIPIGEIVELAARLTRRYLILELVDPADTMFQRLARGNRHLYSELTLERQEEAFAQRFEIVERCPLEGIARTLYVMKLR